MTEISQSVHGANYIVLKIPQNDPAALLDIFDKLLKELNDFSEKLIVLKVGAWTEFPLSEIATPRKRGF